MKKYTKEEEKFNAISHAAGIVIGAIVGALFLVTGNYLPKYDYRKNYNTDREKARKINRFIGYESVIMGILFMISIFLPPAFSASCIFLLIPYTVIAIIYSIIVGRKSTK